MLGGMTEKTPRIMHHGNFSNLSGFTVYFFVIYSSRSLVYNGLLFHYQKKNVVSKNISSSP